MIRDTSYKANQFNLSGLKGISDQTLEMHFKVYEGYVKGTNKLNEKINAFLADGKDDQEEVPAYSELTRRMGFEYNGMVLHEYYFGNLSRGGVGDPFGSPFGRALKILLVATTCGKQTLSV
jgi:superoxide dismutase, Fe-Mn family